MTEEQLRSIRRSIRKVLGTKFTISIKEVDEYEVWVTLSSKVNKTGYTIIVSRPSAKVPYTVEVEEKGSLDIITSHSHPMMNLALEQVLSKLEV